MDLLTTQSDDSPSGIEILDEFRALPIRRRPRRGSRVSGRPFDAAEIHLTDSQKPIEDWRPSALFTELRDQSAPPLDVQPEDLAIRPSRTTIILERFAEIGLDGERILRSILVKEMAQVVVTITAMPILLGWKGGIAELPEGPGPVLAAWSAVLTGEERTPREWFELAKAECPAWSQRHIWEVFNTSRRVALWLASLPLADLLVWKAPSREQFVLLQESNGIHAVAEDRWMLDRFRWTYLEDWDYESLLLEWKYLHGNLAAPCAAEAMRTRHVPSDELGQAISWRASSGEVGRKSRSMTVGSFVAPAVTHLEAGRFSAAAAIFDACRIAVPEDGDAHNNYGFCVLPADPKTALDALEHAANLGVRDTAVNAANQMVALQRLGRVATALEVASRIASSTAWSRPAVAYLWSWDSETPKLAAVADARVYIAEFALSIARGANDDAAARSWAGRLQELQNHNLD